MTKASLLLVIATLMTALVLANSDDVEIIDVDDTQPIIKEPTARKPDQKKQPEKWVWSDEALRD